MNKEEIHSIINFWLSNDNKQENIVLKKQWYFENKNHEKMSYWSHFLLIISLFLFIIFAILSLSLTFTDFVFDYNIKMFILAMLFWLSSFFILCAIILFQYIKENPGEKVWEYKISKIFFLDVFNKINKNDICYKEIEFINSDSLNFTNILSKKMQTSYSWVKILTKNMRIFYIGMPLNDENNNIFIKNNQIYETEQNIDLLNINLKSLSISESVWNIFSLFEIVERICVRIYKINDLIIEAENYEKR
ncbi:hypothetical protein [Mesomycoplasma lagogenitalium]|uniref:DUF3137 domain-containing protein n=1 Tax=Mesomycoplasma lagogenitalium TaxID=171286 RepID=A0ABY8LWW4_9BACT|nr:hypothetical protein [Mesomycoplasma lagogenitalium]WGI36612.1 hypothetical protein QEG99_04070 [Mesomycoplasma lagogenitalium]